MREIQFRAWDSFRKKMNYNPIVSDGTDGGETASVYLNNAIDCFDGVLMQYTGLKDKNGKDIYEGDILFFESSHVYSEVYFDNGCFRLKSNIEPLTYYIASFAELKGNIYETPELL